VQVAGVNREERPPQKANNAGLGVFEREWGRRAGGRKSLKLALLSARTQHSTALRVCVRLHTDTTIFFGKAARVAVPELQQLLLDPNTMVQAAAQDALEHIAPEIFNTSPERQ
jgi:hypothetical protein